MRHFVCVCITLFSGALHAAPVTIDFEGFTPGFIGLNGPGGQTSLLQVEGFDFVASTFSVGDGPFPGGQILIGNSGSLSLTAVADGGFSQDGFSPTASIFVSRPDGQPFALLAADVFIEELNPGVFGFARSGIEGTLAAGGTVTGATPLGTGGWLNLQSFRVFATGDGVFAFGTSAVEIDNVVVNVVPIPAAVWLFASALGLLGVRRAARNAGLKPC